jgi:hypothetical protein
MTRPIKIKLLTRGSKAKNESRFARQLSGSDRVFGRCQFTFNALDDDYDWLVILDDISRHIPDGIEILKCPRENTIFVTTEPSSITKYGKAFAAQFQYVITNQNEKALPHPNAMRSQTGNAWFYGKTLDEILSVKEPSKMKKISTVCSNKRQGHTVHRQRYDFTAIMEERIPELERFGRGFKWIETKAEAIDDYEFHVAIENQYAPHVWTEKLADTYLGFAVPIYYGCPNIAEYFPEDSYILIDIYDVEGSIEKIKQIISTPGEYERRLPAVKEARRRVIEEYNLLAMIDKIVTEHQNDPKSPVDPEKNKIYNRRKMRTMHLSDLFSFLGWKLKISVQNMLSKLT